MFYSIKLNKKGFTLIELLVVIVVLAVVMVLVVPTVIGSMSTSKQKTFNIVGENIIKYLKDNYNNCKLGNKIFANYDEQIFNSDCTLNIINTNFNNNLIVNSGYSTDDIEKIKIYQIIDDEFSIIAYPNENGIWKDSEIFTKNIYKDNCWALVPDGENNYKAVEFYGINHKTGNVNESCGVTKDNADGFYIVNIPSDYLGFKITKIGNMLFFPGDFDNLTYNKYLYIKEINISEDITEIEDGYELDLEGVGEIHIGSFVSLGYNLIRNEYLPSEGVKINFPSTLNIIGDYAFSNLHFEKIEFPNNLIEIGNYSFFKNNLSNISIPENVETIGSFAFYSSLNLSEIVIPKNVKVIGESAFENSSSLQRVTFVTDEDGNSNLETISSYAFSSCNLNYQDRDDPFIIPKSIKSVESYAFHNTMGNTLNPNLKYIQYKGSNQDIINNTNGWYNRINELITN